MAVNVVRGNGLSLQEEAPFEQTFFREPGYPLFLAGVYWVVNLFRPVDYIHGLDAVSHKLDRIYPEIVAAKVVQSIMGAISIVFVFTILVRIASVRIAFVSGAFSAYINGSLPVVKGVEGFGK